ncbi:MAG: FAD-dependent oxidoreductase [Salinivirgaceae bacterium]|nr:FAD-dependent oxidoreductase [Salinivirgaceae bacterium]
MQKEITLVLTPKQASSEEFYLPVLANQLKVAPKRITCAQVLQRSIDARQKQVKINLRLLVYIDAHPPEEEKTEFNYQQVSYREPVVIVGAGPAGLFAALKLIELGYKPIVIERGKDVNTRKRDIAAIHRNQGVNPDSNYSFGEGGAGTYSDGKLYTRSKKRGNVKSVLNVLSFHGANREILVDAHPHIGTDKLPDIIKSIRQTIIHFGGEVHFETALASLLIGDQTIKGIKTRKGDTIDTKAVILATGHSARDVYQMLFDQQIALEAKPFAMGVRIEHPQELIDSIQYSCTLRDPYLPAASYSLVQQVADRGVYSFCMCPGGVIVPASTAEDEMVVNGMSPSLRNTRWANSGIVVEIQLNDVNADQKLAVLNGLKYQQQFEKLAFKNGGEGQIAPAQRMTDFVENRLSETLPESSFFPGITASPMHEWMPGEIRFRLQEGFKIFGQKMKGYYTSEAVLIGVESRTSSPLRIPRNPETMQHIQITGLFPCGEGAGYAGGIASSAVDGENCAIHVAQFLKK